MNRKMSTNPLDGCVRPIAVGCWLAIAVACGGSSKSSPGSGAAGTDSGAGTTTTGPGNPTSGGTAGTVAAGATGDVGSGGADSTSTSSSTGDAGMGATSTSSGGASSGAAGESSDTGGSGGTDSGSGGTGGSGGASTGGTGGTGGGPTGVVEELGSECDTPAALACAGNHQRVSLICVGGTWQVNETCPENHACDTTPGFDQGTCKERLPECADQEPGQGALCEDSTTLLQCGPDNVTLEPVACEGSCYGGACDNRPNHCPAEPFINCGSECGEVSAAHCSNGADCKVASAAFMPFEEPGQSYLVRVGDYDTLCDLNCETPERHVFWLYAVTDVTMRWRISVPAPLQMAGSNFCGDQSAGGCVVVGPDSGETVFLGLVITDDPAAPEQTILVESAAVGETLECP